MNCDGVEYNYGGILSYLTDFVEKKIMVMVILLGVLVVCKCVIFCPH